MGTDILEFTLWTRQDGEEDVDTHHTKSFSLRNSIGLRGFVQLMLKLTEHKRRARRDVLVTASR